MVVITNPYSASSQRVARNMNSTASTHRSFFDVVERDEYFAFLLNLPIAARYASMDIMIKNVKSDVRISNETISNSS